MEVAFDEPNFTDMIKAHHEEAGLLSRGIPLDVDYDEMIRVEREGFYHSWCGWDGDHLASYLSWWIVTPLQYRTTKLAVDDVHYMEPQYRRGWNGVRMFRECFAALKTMGVKRYRVHRNRYIDLSPLFRRLGAEPEVWGWGGEL